MARATAATWARRRELRAAALEERKALLDGRCRDAEQRQAERRALQDERDRSIALRTAEHAARVRVPSSEQDRSARWSRIEAEDAAWCATLERWAAEDRAAQLRMDEEDARWDATLGRWAAENAEPEDA